MTTPEIPSRMTPEAAAALRERFPDHAIGKLPKGGTMLDYVGHAATTSRLLEVDPEWNWEPMAYDDQGLPLIRNGELWIRLTVCGVTRPGVGDGKSTKEMIGDAIRNAAMRFGVALDLWSKEEITAPARTVRTAKLELVNVLGGNTDAAAAIWKAGPCPNAPADTVVSDPDWQALVDAAQAALAPEGDVS